MMKETRESSAMSVTCPACGLSASSGFAASSKRASAIRGDDEDGDPGRRARYAHLGREPSEAQDDDRDRWAPDPLAHHEAVFALRLQRLHRLPWLQGLRHQGVLLSLIHI